MSQKRAPVTAAAGGRAVSKTHNEVRAALRVVSIEGPGRRGLSVCVSASVHRPSTPAGALFLLVALLLVWAGAASADQDDCVARALPSGGPGHCTAYSITTSTVKVACDHQELMTASREWAKSSAPSAIGTGLDAAIEAIDTKNTTLVMGSLRPLMRLEERWRRAVAACTR